MSEEQRNVTVTVKWFKPDKGYGFVRLADGTGEAFLHSSALAGHDGVTLVEGMALVCDIAQGSKGPQVVTIHAVATPLPPEDTGQTSKRVDRRSARERTRPAPQLTDVSVPLRPRREDRRREPPTADVLAPAAGTVRWYNLDSQSGIIDPDDGGAGVYFDRITLRQSGIDIVADGEEVWYTARGTAEGPAAERVSLTPIIDPR